jgi:predicted XRE-type DNA-binding protein
MPNAKSMENKPPHITKGDVFDDLGLSRAEVLEAKIKADIWRMLVSHIEGLRLKQKDLAVRLDVHQPDVSNLLGGKISKFSVGTFIQFAVKLELGVHVRLSAPKPQKVLPLLTANASKPSRPSGRKLTAVA